MGFGRRRDIVKEDGLPNAQKMRTMWQEIGEELLAVRRHHALNLAFYAGDQHVKYDLTSRSVALVDYRSDHDAETRLTVNQVRPRVNGLLGRLVGQDLSFEIHPQSLGTASFRRQRLQEHLLEAERRNGGWETARKDEVLAAILGGCAAVSVEYDPSGKSLQIVTDPVSGTARRVSGMKVSALSIAEFGLEPGSRSVTDAGWWMKGTTLTPAQAKSRYQLADEPKPDATSQTAAFQTYMTRRLTGGTRHNRCLVLCLFKPPVDGEPGGIVHIVGDHRVAYPWSLPTAELNLEVFRYNTLGTGTWIGDTPLNDTRQVQVAYNEVRTTVRAHAQRASNARIVHERGAIDDDDIFTNEVGEMLGFTGQPGVREPHWMEAPEIPRWLQAEPSNLAMEMDEQLSTHAISKGQQQGDRNSGLALSILAEKDDTPLGPFAREQAAGWARIGRMTLQLLRAEMEEVNAAAVEEAAAEAGVEMAGPPPAILKARTTYTSKNRVPVVREWTHEDLDEDPVVTVPLEAVQPRSMAATKAELISMAQAFPNVAASVTMQQLAKLTGVTTLDEAFAAMDSDVACAMRENEMMLEGAVAEPETWHEHAIHIRVHNDLRNTMDYDTAEPAVQAMVDMHVQAHELMAAQDIAAQMPQMPGAMPELGPGPGAPEGDDELLEGEVPPPGPESAMAEEMIPPQEGELVV